MIRQHQHLGQKQLLKLSPQQIQLLNFLQLNTLELEQKIKDELEENPALEAELSTLESDIPASELAESDSADEEAGREDAEDYDPFEVLDQYQQDDETPDYKTASDTRSNDEIPYTPIIVQGKDFREQLKDQLSVMTLAPRERLMTGYVVDSLDDDGYLRIELADMADNLSFAQSIFVEEDELENALKTVQGLDPAGVGARDLRECLLLQLEVKHHHISCIKLAYTIVDNHLTDLANRNYDKMMHALGASAKDMKAAAAIIEKLSPRPVGSSTADLVKNQNIIPEFIVEKGEDNTFNIQLTNSNTAGLRLSSDMVDMLESMRRDKSGKQSRSAVQYLRSKVNSALWFMEMVRQREHSMLKTIQAIVLLQEQFFRNGEFKDLRPMILKDVAEHTGLDISTISRITSMKYALTDFGIVHLKELFNGGLVKTDGEMVTKKEISNLIDDLIQNEDKQNPIADQEIAEILHKQGYTVARRTVAKYRDAMNLPVAKMRKALPQM